MADGRMWLKCKCGEQFLLAKHFTNGYYIRSQASNEKDFSGRFQDFLDKHFECREINDFDHDVFELDYE